MSRPPLLTAAAASASALCSACVRAELGARLLLAGRSVQLRCVQRAETEPSSGLCPLLSQPSEWSALLADLHSHSRTRAAESRVNLSLAACVQQIMAASVRLAAAGAKDGSSSTLSPFLYNSLLPALRSALLSPCSAEPVPPPPPSASLSAVLSAVPRSLLYQLLVSGCVATADCCASGHSVPPALHSLWRSLESAVDLTAASVAQLRQSLSVSLPSPQPLPLLTVASYVTARLPLVCCLTSARTAAAPSLHELVSSDQLPSAAALLSSSVASAFDVLASLSPAGSDEAAATRIESGRLRLQCAEFILFALTAASTKHQRRPHLPQYDSAQQPRLSSAGAPEAAAALPPPRALTSQLQHALAQALADDDTEAADILQRAFIALVASDTCAPIFAHAQKRAICHMTAHTN